MKTNIKIGTAYRELCSKIYSFTVVNSEKCLFFLGAILLTAGLSGVAIAQSFHEPGYEDVFVRGAVGNLFCLIEGAFGALIMVVAGLGAIVAAAMGAYRAAVGMLVVAVGAFILRSLVSLFFGTDYEAVGGSCDM